MLYGVQVPALWAAHLGQCFSTTEQTIEISKHEVLPLWLGIVSHMMEKITATS